MRRAVLRWHRRHRRDLPWRRTHDPYRILVSEVMLQQTRVDQVVPRYRRFLRRFPTRAALARATPAAVLREWYGLGYNRRALHLHRAVRALAGRPFPRSVAELERLPGLGRYTAGAVATFAWNAPEPLLETNTARVLHRVFVGVDLPLPLRTRAQLFALAERVLDRRAALRWNEALFDLGATVCTKRAPRCSACPLSGHCRAEPRIRKGSAVPAPRRAEPSFHGVPRRIWRGRVLRTLHGGALAPSGVVRRLALSPQDRGFVLALLRTLVDEGLAVRRGRSFALPGSGVVR